MKKIYVCCPANSYTGGPTLAHQLCYILNKNGYDASMLYYGVSKDHNLNDLVHPNYRSFNNPYVTNVKDSPNNIIVSTETYTKILNKFKKSTKIIWWMSVDNYFATYGGFINKVLTKMNLKSDIDLKMSKVRKNKKLVYKSSEMIHLVQSEYARLFLIEEGVNIEKIHYLSDFLEDQIFKEEFRLEDKKNIVTYNPKKGFEFTKKIIENNRNINWVPLINMTKSEIIGTLKASKLYIDFGNHPGKDRFPREAVILGNCVITGKRGSAKNDIDVPIHSKYKFDDSDLNIERISSEINFILDNYETCYKDFTNYKTLILKEREIFEDDTIKVFKRLIETQK